MKNPIGRILVGGKVLQIISRLCATLSAMDCTWRAGATSVVEGAPQFAAPRCAVSPSSPTPLNPLKYICMHIKDLNI